MKILAGIPPPQRPVIRICYLLEICHRHRADSIDRSKGIGDLFQALPDQTVHHVRTKLPHQRIHASPIIPETIVDIPGVLFLEAIGEGHTFHHEEGHDGGNAHVDGIFPASRQFSLDRYLPWGIERQIAPSHFTRLDPLQLRVTIAVGSLPREVSLPLPLPVPGTPSGRDRPARKMPHGLRLSPSRRNKLRHRTVP